MAASPLKFYSQTVGTTQWNPQQVAGRGTTFSSPSIACVGDSTAIAAQGPNNSLEVYFQTIGTSPWNPQQVAGPGSTFSAPSITQVGNSTVIAAAGPNHSVNFFVQAIGATGWNQQQVAPSESVLKRDCVPAYQARAIWTSLHRAKVSSVLKVDLGAARTFT